MIVIKNQVHFDKVAARAAELGITDALNDRIEYLAKYACHETPEDTRCLLFPDFAPLSFSFVMERRVGSEYRRWFNGGLIYEGPSQPADGSAPALTVSVGSPIHGWSVHT